MQIIIIGNGAAGIAAAEAVRKADASASITMITDETYAHYSRPRVIDYLAGHADITAITIKKPDWYAKNTIVFKNGRVHKLDTRKKEILTASETFAYDKLIIASGASSSVPPFEGASTQGVFTLRTIEDADRIKESARTQKQAVAIGAGLLGIEAAYALISLGLSVTVVEFFDRLLPRQLDLEASDVLQTMLEKKGLGLKLSKKTKRIVKEGELIKVEFEDGESVSGGFVLISAGIKPNIEIFKEAGIECERAIKVNSRMETNLPGIFACGDCTQFNGMNYGIWPAAVEQGAIAGANAAGENKEYPGTVMSTKLKAAGIELASIGQVAMEEGMETRVTKEGSRFKKLFIKNGLLAGAILIGDTKEFGQLKGMLGKTC